MKISLGYLYLLLLWAFGSAATPIGTGSQAVLENRTSANFTAIGDKLYYIEETLRVNWFRASNICRQLGGFLVNLASKEELQALSRQLHPARSYWLSLYDLAEPGVYASQANGRDAQFLSWSAGQPDNIGGVEHCIELWLSGSTFQMNDAQCEMPFHFVCESD
ncbi:C-type lectin 37Db isoform X2 [Drosophila novamexicana]|uniref:C-type lectin 37Db isoform X2 n=1 Tax=Drosophila novamexicana TaxID=47314 RepID=UPI0011E58D1C|nr:C-type lectin 37Db isoform X2 [Drosophila novamexicana]